MESFVAIREPLGLHSGPQEEVLRQIRGVGCVQKNYQRGSGGEQAVGLDSWKRIKIFRRVLAGHASNRAGEKCPRLKACAGA